MVARGDRHAGGRRSPGARSGAGPARDRRSRRATRSSTISSAPATSLAGSHECVRTGATSSARTNGPDRPGLLMSALASIIRGAVARLTARAARTTSPPVTSSSGNESRRARWAPRAVVVGCDGSPPPRVPSSARRGWRMAQACSSSSPPSPRSTRAERSRSHCSNRRTSGRPKSFGMLASDFGTATPPASPCFAEETLPTSSSRSRVSAMPTSSWSVVAGETRSARPAGVRGDTDHRERPVRRPRGVVSRPQGWSRVPRRRGGRSNSGTPHPPTRLGAEHTSTLSMIAPGVSLGNSLPVPIIACAGCSRRQDLAGRLAQLGRWPANHSSSSPVLPYERASRRRVASSARCLPRRSSNSRIINNATPRWGAAWARPRKRSA
jgi:hypothetical protein